MAKMSLLAEHKPTKSGHILICQVCCIKWPCRVAHERVSNHCRSCGALIWWGLSKAGKPCPFNVVDGERTEVSHFTTCPDASRWSKR